MLIFIKDSEHFSHCRDVITQHMEIKDLEEGDMHIFPAYYRIEDNALRYVCHKKFKKNATVQKYRDEISDLVNMLDNARAEDVCLPEDFLERSDRFFYSCQLCQSEEISTLKTAISRWLKHCIGSNQ